MAVVANYSSIKQGPFPGQSYASLSVYNDSNRSPRVNGKLRLQSNPWFLRVITDRRQGSKVGSGISLQVQYLGSTSESKILRAQAVAGSDVRRKLASKVKNGHQGALGVSIAQSGQAIAMMRNSGTSLMRIFSAAERFYRTTKGKRRAKRLRKLINRGAPVTAGMVLEGFFGWAPLIGDFATAMGILANPWPPGWVSAAEHFAVSPTVIASTSEGSSSSARWTRAWSATGRVSYACSVEVANPNIWIANQLGLLNLPGVAWDMVPWSFLVNAVSNMGQVMGSLTDFAGLSLSNPSLTKSTFLHQTYTGTWWTSRQNPFPGFSQVSGEAYHKVRSRSSGAMPSVTPYLKFPQWGVGQAAIVGSLLIQQVNRLSKAFAGAI